MNPTDTTPWQKFRPKIIIFGILALVVYIFYFVATHGFLTVTLSGDSAQQTVMILDQGNNEKSEKVVNGGSFRKFVRKSDYEVMVQGSNGGAWRQVASKGFLRNQTAALEPKPEKLRTFVADSPGGCTNYDQQLLSFACDNDLDFTLHNVGTSTTPPLVSAALGDIEGSVTSVVSTPSGTVALSQILSEDDENAAPVYQFVTLTSLSFKSERVFTLNGLKADSDYLAKPYRQGILVYDKTFTDVLYYSGPDAAGQRINLPAVDEDLSAFAVETSTTSFVISYQNREAIPGDSTVKPNKDARTAATIVEEGMTAKTYYFDTAWASVAPCGKQKICTTTFDSDKVQTVIHDTSGSKPKRLFAVNNVSRIFNVPDGGVLAITDAGVLRLDTTNRAARLDFSFGDYKFCGVGQARISTQYTLCITGKAGAHTLLLDSTAEDKDQIDSKATSLRDSSSISAAIFDRNRIYIVRDYGEDVFVEAEQSFLPDPAKVTAVDKEITRLVGELQFAQLGYEVINTN